MEQIVIKEQMLEVIKKLSPEKLKKLLLIGNELIHQQELSQFLNTELEVLDPCDPITP